MTSPFDIASTMASNSTNPDSKSSPILSPFQDPSNFPFVSMKASALAGLVVWTIIANTLVFVVLYKNPRLQTVPNFLVANLAFSDLCIGLVVLPLAAVYAVALSWPFGKIICEIWLSSDVLCSSASIWNLSIIGLDRYWAITSPITYITKRTMRSAMIMISGVWALSMLISVAPFFGWRNLSEKGNYVFNNETSQYQCVFLDLPAYSIYSTTGSFVIPLLVMFFVYFQIYRAFAEHKARHMYRQSVLRKHIESTILHEINHFFPIPRRQANNEDLDEEEEEEEEEEEDESEFEEEEEGSEEKGGPEKNVDWGSIGTSSTTLERSHSNNSKISIRNGHRFGGKRRTVRSKRSLRGTRSSNAPRRPKLENKAKSFTVGSSPRDIRRPLIDHGHFVQNSNISNKQQLQRQIALNAIKKPAAISAVKEKRGVKVLGIILGCFTICWIPFFVMYFVTGLCQNCRPNANVEQFITWLGYSNSAMNPIIYTVFNREYQQALKRLFSRGRAGSTSGTRRKPRAV